MIKIYLWLLDLLFIFLGFQIYYNLQADCQREMCVWRLLALAMPMLTQQNKKIQFLLFCFIMGLIFVSFHFISFHSIPFLFFIPFFPFAHHQFLEASFSHSFIYAFLFVVVVAFFFIFTFLSGLSRLIQMSAFGENEIVSGCFFSICCSRFSGS